MNINPGRRTGDLDGCIFPTGRGKQNARIVGETESFFRHSEEISVEMMVCVFIVKTGDPIAARRHIGERENRSICRNWNGLACVSLIVVLRPAIWGFKHGTADYASSIAEAVDMNR